jgi:RNA polymerase-binding transcription factor DksA
MARQLAASTLKRLGRKLADERERLEKIIRDHERDRENAMLAEGPADRSPDPDNVDGGAIAVELETDRSVVQNSQDLLDAIQHAQDRMEKGLYGICEVTGEPIPLARLEAIPYATTTVQAAQRG